MNQRPQGLKVQKAMTGFLHYKSAEGLAPVTVSGYERDLKLWIEYLGDVNISKVQSSNILAFLNYLRTDYVPRRITGNNSRKLAPKTVYNIYVSLASFFTWASREFQLDNPLKNIPRLRVPEDPPVEPFKKEEIELLIKACDFCEEAETALYKALVASPDFSQSLNAENEYAAQTILFNHLLKNRNYFQSYLYICGGPPCSGTFTAHHFCGVVIFEVQEASVISLLFYFSFTCLHPRMWVMPSAKLLCCSFPRLFIELLWLSYFPVKEKIMIYSI
jgi:hypothetical protein